MCVCLFVVRQTIGPSQVRYSKLINTAEMCSEERKKGVRGTGEDEGG